MHEDELNGKNNEGTPGADEQRSPAPVKPSDTRAASAGVDELGQGSHTSEKKKETNRENAKQSTGPRTERGKRTVRRNPLEHGFYATDAVMGDEDGWEHTEEFIMLLEALKRDWNPQGVTEESCVHELAVLEWRRRRSYRSEVGEIRRTAGSLRSRKFFDMLESNPVVDAVLASGAHPKEREGITAAFVEAQLLLLSMIRDEVERQGYISATSQKALDKSFGRQASSFATKCYELSCLAQRQLSPQERESPNPERERILRLLHPDDFEEVSAEQCKQLLLRHIDIGMGLLRILHKDIEEVEQRNTIATLMAHNLPSKEYVDKSIRYEAGLDRRKEKTIKLLLELQARRKAQQN